MGAKNLEILGNKSPKTPEIWPKSGRNFRNFSAFCPKFRENFLAALVIGGVFVTQLTLGFWLGLKF